MTSTPNDLDPRLILMSTEASFISHNSKTPRRAMLVLSRVGLHVYAPVRYGAKYPYTASAVEHGLLSDFDERKTRVGGLRTKMMLPLGLKPRIYQIGYVSSHGYTSAGGMLAGIANAAKVAATRNVRERLLQAIVEARQHCPPFEQPAGVHPHLARMRWFARQSAYGPALDHADMALQAAELQRIHPNGPGIFQRGKYFDLGWDRRGGGEILPRLSSADIQAIRRERAWLLFDGERFATLAKESVSADGSDPELLVVCGVACVLAGSDKADELLARAENVRIATPVGDPVGHARTLAGIALRRALQQQPTEARALMNTAEQLGADDRRTQLLLGIVCQRLEDRASALQHFMASAALAHGYFEGSLACTQAYACTFGDAHGLETAERLTTLLPDHTAAWQTLALAARTAGNQDLAREALERIAVMESAVA